MPPDIDILQILTSTSPTLGIAIYCIYQMRLDRADALRRELQYSEQLKADRQELIALLRENTSVNRGLTDELHDLKNVIQKVVLHEGQLRAPRGGD